MSRTWMINPRIMCKNHLLGEHREIHQIVGTIKSDNLDISDWEEKGFVYPSYIIERHNALVREFKRRGWPSGQDHSTPVEPIDLTKFRRKKVNSRKALNELLDRCENCRERYWKHQEEKK